MKRGYRPCSRRNWTRTLLIAIWIGGLAIALLWRLAGCGSAARPGIVYVPDTDKILFVSPGDRIVDPNGATRDVVAYKGVVLSNQRYIELLKGAGGE